MKYITFYRENNNFNDIITDTELKRKIKEKTTWLQHLVIGIKDDDRVLSYITLKFGDSIKTDVVKDFSPIPFVDYIPKR